MKYLLGIDFGGGASKATLLGTDGRIYADNTVEYPTLHPEMGFCEQSPEDWMNALYSNVSALMKRSGISPSDILMIAIVVFLGGLLIAQGITDSIHKTNVYLTEGSRL